MISISHKVFTYSNIINTHMFLLFYVHVRSVFNRLIIRFAVLCSPEPFYQRMPPFQIAFLTDIMSVRLNGSNRKVHPLRNLLVCVLFGYKFLKYYLPQFYHARNRREPPGGCKAGWSGWGVGEYNHQSLFSYLYSIRYTCSLSSPIGVVTRNSTYSP